MVTSHNLQVGVQALETVQVSILGRKKKEEKFFRFCSKTKVIAGYWLSFWQNMENFNHFYEFHEYLHSLFSLLSVQAKA